MKPFKAIFTLCFVLSISSCGGGGSNDVISRDASLSGLWVGSNGDAPDNGYFLFENLSSFDGLATFYFLDSDLNCFDRIGPDEIVNVGGNRYRDSAGEVVRLTVQNNLLTVDFVQDSLLPNLLFRQASGISTQDLPICAMKTISNESDFGFVEQLEIGFSE